MEFTVAGEPLPALDETKHFKLIGTTGTGKSTATASSSPVGPRESGAASALFGRAQRRGVYGVRRYQCRIDTGQVVPTNCFYLCFSKSTAELGASWRVISVRGYIR
jgi:hypothetical protein